MNLLRFAAAAGLFAFAVGFVIVIVYLRRITPAERERRRRSSVNRRGRLIDGEIIDWHDSAAFYKYTVNGVDYETSQDVSSLLGLLRCEPHRVLGPATVKYLRDNPGDSIVICEEWSGLRQNRHVTL